jgi:hypothetical protein
MTRLLIMIIVRNLLTEKNYTIELLFHVEQVRHFCFLRVFMRSKKKKKKEEQEEEEMN